MFNRPVSQVKVSVLDAGSAVVAASPEVVAKQLTGRHTITLAAKSGTIYIGDKTVTSANGLPLASGETLTIPVASDRTDQVYVVGGDVVLTEWF